MAQAVTNQRVPPESYPWWVKLARMGSRSRRSQWFWFVFEVVFAVVFVLFAILDTGTQRIVDVVLAIWAGVIAVASLATIEWVDRYGTWES